MVSDLESQPCPMPWPDGYASAEVDGVRVAFTKEQPVSTGDERNIPARAFAVVEVVGRIRREDADAGLERCRRPEIAEVGPYGKSLVDERFAAASDPLHERRV